MRGPCGQAPVPLKLGDAAVLPGMADPASRTPGATLPLWRWPRMLTRRARVTSTSPRIKGLPLTLREPADLMAGLRALQELEPEASA